MAKGNGTDELSTPSSSKRTAALRAKPYDPNNVSLNKWLLKLRNFKMSNSDEEREQSFIKKVATKMTDIIPQRSWISKWFNSSQDEPDLQETETDNVQFDDCEEKQLQPPPMKRACIRMDVTHPPGTFNIQPRNRNVENDAEPSKDHFSNHNETTQDFLEPLATGRRLDRFVASTPAFSMDTAKATEARSSLNVMMSEQNNNGTTNGVDDNSESSESTSGCSSLIPQNNRQEAPLNSSYNTLFGNKRRFVDEKFSFTNHLQSPRSLFLDSSHRETLASRRPSFNPSMMNNSTLNKSSSLLSPFYPGNTTFGGANAANLYRSNSALTDPSQFQNKTAPKRASVEVNPSNKSSSIDLSGMSHTAKRILETLEQFSSPLSDAKKMPVRNIMGSNSSFHSSHTTSRKRSREDDIASPKVGLRHLTRELTVPTVPDMLRIRRKQKLQNSTVNARKIASARNVATAPPPAQQEYHIRTEADIEPARNSQLKAKKKTNLEQQETVEAVNLPTIPLPISSLPRFDISLPQATKPATPDRSKQQPLFQLQSNDDFKFASPIRLSEANKTLESINNFTFSKPITPSKISGFSTNDSEDLSRTLSIDSNDTFNTTNSFPNFIWAGPSQTALKPKEKVKEKKEEVTGGIKVATELKQGSVIDFFKKEAETASKLAETQAIDESMDLWECNECLIKNNGKETHCVACKSVKPSGDSSSSIEVLEIDDDVEVMIVEPAPTKNESKPKSKSRTSNSSIFNKSSNAESICVNMKLSVSNFVEMSTTDSPASPSDTLKSAKKSTWECPCCMVRNADSATSCPCCSTAKPGSVNVSPKRTVESAPSATTTSGFGDKFKKPEGSWNCDTCMIQNKSDVTKCAACETPRPGAKPAAKAASGFGDMFKKPEGSWTCDSCMIQNKSDVVKCAACETPKPGASSSKASGFGDMFKKPEGSWTCDSCMVSNKSVAEKCIACATVKPGTEKPKSNLQFKVDMPANAGSFKFGIDKADAAAAALPKANGFNFGGSASAQATSGGFSFGSPKDSAGFAFTPSESVSAAATFQFGAKPIETKTNANKEEVKSSTTATFSFGASPKSDAPATTGFVFGASTTTVDFGKNKDDKAATPLTAPSAGFSLDSTDASSTLATKEDKSKQPSETPTATFVFGTSKPATYDSPKETSKSVATSFSTSETPKAALSFGVPASTESKSAATPALFTFGAAAAASTSTSTSTTTSTPTSLFTFTGAQKTSETSATNTTSLPAFGSPAAPKPTFSFGKPAETASVQQNESKPTLGLTSVTSGFGRQTNQATPSLFGNITATSSSTGLGSAENKTLLFGTSEKKAPPSFGEPSAKLPAFGSTTDAKPTTSVFPSTAVTPAFGASAPATNPTATSSPFGSTGNMFGSPATSTFGSTAPAGIFSATTKASETAAATPGLFTFGASSQAATPATGSFNFSTGSNTTATSGQQKAGIFSFGASSSATPAGNGFGSGGTFGAAATSSGTSAATANFSFNAPKSDVSSFGTATPAPMFNATSAQPAGHPPAYPGTASTAPAAEGFNFGNTTMPASFNFGSTPAPATGGFNFNAPSTPTAPPTFDPNAQPTFNFTGNSGAPTTFNAPGSYTVPPSRKIKKAVRRMPRQ